MTAGIIQVYATRMAQRRAVILGAGMVGSVMAADLSSGGEFDVTIADRSPHALDRAVKQCGRAVATEQVDLSDVEAVKRTVATHDIVLGALASTIGFQTLRAVLEAGKPYCDISFMPENALELDALAKTHGATAVVDCGVAPGMSNLLSGYGASLLDECQAIEIYVGGVPRDPKPPFYYKAAFSPADVIEEYTRPARLVENGAIVTREALSEAELIEFPGVGTLEAFNTDGLRSIMFTMNAPNMKEKTLRWPGHIELMRAFRHAGLFSKTPIEVPVCSTVPARVERVRPLDLTSAVLFPQWMYDDGEDDLTVMRVIVTGLKKGRPQRHQWDLYDRRDRETGFTSMARTTAYPCTIIARLLAEGRLSQGPGVIVPELLGSQHELVKHVLDGLAARNITLTAT